MASFVFAYPDGTNVQQLSTIKNPILSNGVNWEAP